MQTRQQWLAMTGDIDGASIDGGSGGDRLGFYLF